MMIGIQLVLYCLLFLGLVAFAARGGAINALFFYPKSVQDRAFELGLSDKETMCRKRESFMIILYITLLVSLVLIIGLWNQVSDFKTAYVQSVLFLVVMNWFDGIVVDKLWVSRSKFWVIPGTEDLPFVQTWKQVLKKRIFLTVIWAVGGVIVAGIVVLVF